MQWNISHNKEWCNAIFFNLVNNSEKDMRSLGGFSSPWHILWTSVDGRSSSFPPGYLESAVPRMMLKLKLQSSRAFPVTLAILKTLSGLLQSPWAPLYIYPSPGGHTLTLYEVSKPLSQPTVALVSLDITKPHPDTSRGLWGASQRELTPPDSFNHTLYIPRVWGNL